MKINDVILQLLLKQPFYGYVAASISPTENDDVDTINILSDQSMKLLYNKRWFESLEEIKAIGVVIHELLHLILMHPFRRDNRELHLWTIACDMAVNEHIEEAMLSLESITVQRISREIKLSLPSHKSAEFYYDELANLEEKISYISDDKETRVVFEDGLELKANNCIEGETSDINKNAFKSRMTELLVQTRSEGEMPDALSPIISEVYKSHEVDWRRILKRFLTGKGKVKIRKTYKRVSKRFEDYPGNKRSFGTNALLAIDESGSISDAQIKKFYSEVMKIKKITGTTIKVTRFDTSCTQPVSLDKYLKDKKRVNNGGTDFRPIFNLADELKFSLLIIFTDGDGAVPEDTNQKVLWVLTKDGKKPTSFGESITFGV